MTQGKQEYLARASLDNLILRIDKEALTFSDFFIKRSPNRIRDIVVTYENGAKGSVPHSPDEDEFEPGFPECEYYLEIYLGKIKRFDFEEAQNRLVWALNRMRLFKISSVSLTLSCSAFSSAASTPSRRIIRPVEVTKV